MSVDRIMQAVHGHRSLAELERTYRTTNVPVVRDWLGRRIAYLKTLRLIGMEEDREHR